MNVLIACECSQVVMKEFRSIGHNAFSADIKDCYGGFPQYHIKGDVLNVLAAGLINLSDGSNVFIDKWDLLIAHPPCTYLSYAGNKYIDLPGRKEKREEAADFFMQFINADIDKICVENPVGYMNSIYRKPDQIVHPYYFSQEVGDSDDNFKRTCFWLKNLFPLPYLLYHLPPEPVYQQVKENGKVKNRYFTECVSSNRSEIRSQTFVGIAKAMAKYWG